MQMKKYIKHIFTISMLLLLFTSQAYACRLMGAIALNGTTLRTPGNAGTYDAVKNEFRSQSTTSLNPHGWGLAYYTNQTGFLTGTGKIFTKNSNIGPFNNNDYILGKRYASRYPVNGNADENTDFYLAFQEALLTYPTVAVGHLRFGTSGDLGTQDPHPFVYTSPNADRNLIFAHNGSIDGGSSNPVTGTCATMKNSVISYLSANPDSSLSRLANYNMDSSIYFAYILMHIQQNGWDILRGLDSALRISNNSSGSIGWNFVMTEGKDLYLYRKSSSDSHTLSYVYFNNVPNNQPTTRYINAAFALTEGFDSDFSPGNSFLTREQFLSHKKTLQNDELVYIPANGRPATITNFTHDTYKLDNKKTNPLTSGQRSVWSWESFPIMQGNAHDAINTFRYPNGGTTDGLGFEHLMKGYEVNGKYVNKNGDLWSYPLGSFDIEPRRGYKLQSSGLDEVKVKGSLCANTGFGQMEVGPVYWVGYWLMNSQSLREALGANFSNVRRVWAENWYYDNMELEQKTGIVNPLNADYPMEFGKMYAIQLSQNASPITNFKWENSRKPAERSLNRTASFFTYDQAESYEAIDILSVSKNSMNYQEIGVFDGETCIGATALDQFPVQILAYTQGREGHPLTFRALNENGAVSEINPVTSAYDSKSGSFQPKLLVAGEIEYAILNIEEKSDDVNSTLPTVLSNSVNYPNPFNPVTNISFTLSKTDRVVVNIYNIKGQLVNSLFDGQLNAGKHFIRWDGKDNDKKNLASGVYFYNIISGNNNITKKMIMMK